MITAHELGILVAEFRRAGGIVRTRNDSNGRIQEISIGQYPGGPYKKLGEPGTGWMSPISAAESIRKALAVSESTA